MHCGHGVVAMRGAPTRASFFERERREKGPLTSFLAPLGLSLALGLSSPCMAIPFVVGGGAPADSPTTPFSQSRELKLGLEGGKIQPCPSVNPSCVSTNPKSSSFAFPLIIPNAASSDDTLRDLKAAIVGTQKNVKFQDLEETPSGQYLLAEVDGGFGRDVMEFLVKGDVVAYRCMATKVTYVYPFTTAFGDSKGQEERVEKIVERLGWYSPKFEIMD